MSSGVQQERSVLGRGMDVVIVCKFRERKESLPVVLSFTDKYPDELFQFLVDSFRLSVGLRVAVQFLHEFRDELGSAVGNDFPWESVKFPYVPKEELRGSGGSDCGSGLDEMASFSGGVYNNHNCVVACGIRKLHNEIYADGVPPFFRDRERNKLSGRKTALGFGSEAHITGRDVPSDITRHIGPPIIPGD
ncbi:hypothetical protein GALMADRAFT_147593 [Galerina marginata CBS 339.88]|uniref:Uncharacterized protein n=1 Tax=Galerina marginata (strain CBS 339.88) TaxID=685588 RepID=A0A067SGX8_GALM3|nr:hypothetical protein GALMADRAFT_147593 [Galerina marginata CBS 339.88]